MFARLAITVQREQVCLELAQKERLEKSLAIEALGFDLNLQLCPPGSYCIHGDKLMTTTDDPDTLMKVKSLRVLWAATAMSLVSRSQHALEFALKATTAQLEQSIP
ncbi:unnamed protein product [Aphanomyces euteiches]